MVKKMLKIKLLSVFFIVLLIFIFPNKVIEIAQFIAYYI